MNLSTPPPALPPARTRIRFDRNEFSGAFGDLGTDFPLVTGLILTCQLDPASVLIVYGLLQIGTGLFYGLPMPVQPLKAMATIAIAQKLAPDTLFGGGMAIGLLMLLLTLTGLLTLVIRWVPQAVVRGVQAGLGLSLAGLALKDYIAKDGLPGYALAVAGGVVVLALLGNRRVPPALVLIGMGLIYALLTATGTTGLPMPALHGPAFRVPQTSDVQAGFWLLAVPQLALSISNSVVATKQTVADLFPDRPLSIRKIGLTYSLMNLISPFFGGIPTCHGSGGVAGHYAFGARTGGSIVIYGAMYLTLGLLFSDSFAAVIGLFPAPVLGVLLLTESLTLLGFTRSVMADRQQTFVAFLVALIALYVPNGYAWGLLIGTTVFYGTKRGWFLNSD
jgi:xanthine/uracil/vitamin C permease (AzgA family)